MAHHAYKTLYNVIKGLPQYYSSNYKYNYKNVFRN